LCWYTTAARKPTITAAPGCGYINSRNPGHTHEQLQRRRSKNRLPSLIDKALDGEEVVITRHGKPVAELRPRRHKHVGITSVELLDQIYEEDDQS
jgi:antitoxin (DNA-binding transcriptional repressor) of toxin-antitoxin stability system